MERDELIASAQAIPQVGNDAINTFEKNSASLAEKVSAIVESHPRFEQVVGTPNLDIMHDNHRNQARFFLSVFVEPSPETFVNTCIWAMGVYRRRGFQPDYWIIMPKAWMQALDEVMNKAEARQIKPLFQWLLHHQSEMLNQIEDSKE